MFLPSKAHSQEIIKTAEDKLMEEQGLAHLLPQGTQYKVRIGNRVPKDAVNLAYVHIPAINSSENVLITELSNTVLENSKNDQVRDIFMHPDRSLLLHTEDGKHELPTVDVSMTNIFKDDTPLYYAHKLTHMHYDNNGPDEYGMYEGNGITIVDRKGVPIDRPYRIQLVSTDKHKLYEVIVFTAFNDTESDTYSVVYNAVTMTAEGRTETISGYREKLNLTRAFTKINSLESMLPLISQSRSNPIYYQGNGTNPAYSKFYVPTPPIKDRRRPVLFRYQVAVEIDIKGKKYIFSTPWMPNSVLNVMSLTNDEKAEYPNGSKLITAETAEQIMRGYVEDSYLYHIYAKKKYFVISNDDKVKTFTRIDGSSPVYARTDVSTDPVDGQFKVPMKVQKTRQAVVEEGIVAFRVRPIKGPDKTKSVISFIVDGSQSMGRFDHDGSYRRNLVQSITQSGQDFYDGVEVNGYYYQNGYVPIREEFSDNIDEFLTKFDEIRNDQDITKPAPAVTQAINDLDAVKSTYTKRVKKTVVVLTDGEFVSISRLTELIEMAQSKGISLSIITFNRFKELKAVCDPHGVLCINALDVRTGMDLRYFFFELGGLEESIYLKDELDVLITARFSMSPVDNDIEVTSLDFSKTKPNGKVDDPLGQYLPEEVINQRLRYGLEIILKDGVGLGRVETVEDLPVDDPMKLTIYMKDFPKDRTLASFNGKDLIAINALFSPNTYRIFAHCESYEYEFNHTYAVRYNDTNQIKVLPPREKDASLSWYPRIKNGRFERFFVDQSGKPLTYTYSVPEYYKQQFIKDMGVPYARILDERPQVLNETQIKVMHFPMHIETSGGIVTNVEVLVNGKPVNVISWNKFDGIFDLDGFITNNDNIRVSYDYLEDSYVYRGYTDADGKFWSLDLNPSAGHYVTIRDRLDQEIKDVPSFALINETIYLYLKPTGKYTPVRTRAVYGIQDQFTSDGFELPEPALMSYEFTVGRVTDTGQEVHLPREGGGVSPNAEHYAVTTLDNVITHIKIRNPSEGNYFVKYTYISDELQAVAPVQSSVVFHTFEKIDNPDAILIGEIHVRPNSNQSSIQLIDTRVRGGGLKPEISQELMKEFENESTFYWDIGYWDGLPYSENAVVVFRLSRRILKEYGGRFTKAEVEDKLMKHFSYGQLPIIEFIEDSDELLSIPEDLVIEVIDIPDDGDIIVETPTYQLILEG